MWYVIQTVTGKEEELMLFMRTILCREHFDNSFVIYAEWMKRLGGEWQIQVRPLFPGYVFIETEEPERIYMELKGVPRYSRLLGTSKDEFIPVKEEEEKFLQMIMNSSDNYNKSIVGLTTVETNVNGNVVSVNGALACFEKACIKVNLHKRYALVKTQMLGEQRILRFGIRLKKDENINETRN